MQQDSMEVTEWGRGNYNMFIYYIITIANTRADQPGTSGGANGNIASGFDSGSIMFSLLHLINRLADSLHVMSYCSLSPGW